MNEFNCYIFAYDDIIDDDDNINNVKDNKVIDNYVLFSNFDINNQEFANTPRSFISEVMEHLNPKIYWKDIKETRILHIFSVDIIDINTLISKIISTSSLDKNNKKLIDEFLGLNFNIKTYTVNQDTLKTSFCELRSFAEKKQILLGLIDYDFKDVQTT